MICILFTSFFFSQQTPRPLLPPHSKHFGIRSSPSSHIPILPKKEKKRKKQRRMDVWSRQRYQKITRTQRYILPRNLWWNFLTIVWGVTSLNLPIMLCYHRWALGCTITSPNNCLQQHDCVIDTSSYSSSVSAKKRKKEKRSIFTYYVTNIMRLKSWV